MSEVVSVNIITEIIKKINEAQDAIKTASTILPDLKDELDSLYNELGELAERVVEILGR